MATEISRTQGIYDGDPNYVDYIRLEVHDIIQGFASEEKNSNVSEQIIRNHALLLYVTTDKLISEIHESYLTSEEILGDVCVSEPVIFSPTMVKIFEQFSYLKDNDHKKNPTKIELKLPEEKPLEFVSPYLCGRHSGYSLFFITALLNNAVIHSIQANEVPHRVMVNTGCDSSYLILSNTVWTEDIKKHEPGNMVTLNAIKYYYDQIAESDKRFKTTFSYSYESVEGQPYIYRFTAKLPRINKYPVP